jgi:hypothetical protein
LSNIFLAAQTYPVMSLSGRPDSSVGKEVDNSFKTFFRQAFRSNESKLLQPLYDLARSNSVDVNNAPEYRYAQRVLLELQAALLPETSLDEDNEIRFDWEGATGAFVTITVGSNGQVAFAASRSLTEKVHGLVSVKESVPRSLPAIVKEYL